MKNIISGLMISILFIATFSVGEAFAAIERIEESAVILFLQGDVKVKKPGLVEWEYAVEGMLLSGGDQIKTGVNSWVEIGFGEDYRNVMRIQEETLVELASLGSTEINLLKGELRTLLEKLKKDEVFEIKTPTAVCGARGTGWDTITDGIKSIVDMYEESIYFAGKSQPKEGAVIKAGKRGILEDPTKPITIRDVPIDRMLDWKGWKEDFRERRGIEKGSQQKAETIQQSQKNVEEMNKGKKGVFEKKDRDLMDKRIESTTDGGY